MKTTCSYFTGRYLLRISFVRRIMNLFTVLSKSASFSSPRARSASVASESRPLRMASSYLERNS